MFSTPRHSTSQPISGGTAASHAPGMSARPKSHVAQHQQRLPPVMAPAFPSLQDYPPPPTGTLTSAAATPAPIAPPIHRPWSSTSRAPSVAPSVASSTFRAAPMQPLQPLHQHPDTSMVLLESERRVMRALPNELPPEVKGLLDELDLDDDLRYRWCLDAKHGICVIAFWDLCHAFSFHTKEGDASPTFLRTFTFPESSVEDVPLIATVTYSDSPQQVGLLAVSSEGNVRFWEDILAENDFKDIKIYIPASDFGYDLVSFEPFGFLFATAQGSMFNIGITSRGGRHHLTYTPLSRSTNLLHKVSGWISAGLTPRKKAPASAGTSTADTSQTVCIVAGLRSRQDHHISVEKQAREAFLVSKSTIVGWAVSRGTPEKFLFEENLLDLVVEDIAALANFAQVPHCEILHVALAKDRRLVVLVGIEVQTDVFRVAVVWLDRTSSPQADKPFSIRMTKIFDASIPVTEIDFLRLHLSNGGPMLYIVGRGIILLSYLHENVTFEELIPFRPESGARILTATSDSSKAWSSGVESVSTLWMFCYPLGLTKLEVNVSKIASDQSLRDRPDEAVQKKSVTSHIKSLMEQAILFGAQAANPVAFEISHDAAQDFSEAAVALSEEILRAEPKQLASVTDIKHSLRERSNLLEALLTCLIDNDVLDRVNPACRFQLMTNAEKLEAFIELWQYHNTLLGRQLHGKSSKYLKLLEECIEIHLGKHGEPLHGYTALRTFFKSHVADAGALIELVFRTSQKHVQSQTGTTVNRHMITFECNRIILAAFKGALRYRRDHKEAYELEAIQGIEPWTATATMPTILQTLFTHTEKTLQEYALENNLMAALSSLEDDLMMEDVVVVDYLSDMSSPDVVLQLFKLQLVELADVLMATYLDRLNMNAGGNVDPALVDQYQATRPKLLSSLAKWGQLQHAYDLAQKYGDFYTLVSLVYAHEKDVSFRFLDWLQRFGDEFAFALYRWHCEHAQYKSLMSLRDEHDESLQRFLESQRRDLLWILDFKRGDFASAATGLYQECMKEKKVTRKQAMLSIAKLAYFAGLKGQKFTTHEIRCSEDILVNLDVLNIQSFFRSLLLESVGVADSTDLSIADTLKLIVESSASDMKARRPTVFSYYCTLIKAILTNEDVGVEGLMDVLTLNYTGPPVDANCFALALEVYSRARNLLLPHRRESCVKAVIRRTLLASCPQLAEYKKVLDGQVVAQLPQLPIYSVLKCTQMRNRELNVVGISICVDAQDQKLGTYGTVEELKFTDRTESVQQKHDNLNADRHAKLFGDLQEENMLMDMYTEQFGLETYYAELLHLIRQ